MPERKFVPVDIGGKSRMLRFDFNALADLELTLGKGLLEIFSEEDASFSVIRGMYWSGLKWQERGLTVDMVGNWLQQALEAGRDLEELLMPIAEAFKEAGLGNTNKAAGDESKNGVRALSGTGKKSKRKPLVPSI